MPLLRRAKPEGPVRLPYKQIAVSRARWGPSPPLSAVQTSYSLSLPHFSDLQ